MLKAEQTQTVDEYIAGFGEEVQTLLRQLRALVQELAPNAQEKIAYRMPGYYVNGKPLIYFAAFKRHIGVYPTGDPLDSLAADIAPYRTSKGTLQFPLNKPLPWELIRHIIEARLTAVGH